MEGSAFPWLAPSPSRPQANPSGGRWRKREPTRDLPPQALQSSRNLSEFVQRPSSRALVGSGFAKIKIRHPGKPAGKPGSPLIRPSAFFGGQGRIAQAIAPLIKNLAGGQGRGPFNPAPLSRTLSLDHLENGFGFAPQSSRPRSKKKTPSLFVHQQGQEFSNDPTSSSVTRCPISARLRNGRPCQPPNQMSPAITFMGEARTGENDVSPSGTRLLSYPPSNSPTIWRPSMGDVPVSTSTELLFSSLGREPHGSFPPATQEAVTVPQPFCPAWKNIPGMGKWVRPGHDRLRRLKIARRTAKCRKGPSP